MEVISLLLDQIRLDGGTQLRTKIRKPVVREYGRAMKAGATFPPLEVTYDNDQYWLTDGFHRLLAVAAMPFGSLFSPPASLKP